MKKKKQKLIIPFVGLKEGMHDFEFEIDSTFFEQFDFSIIESANFHVAVKLEKKINMLNLHFDLEGVLHMSCDRCNDAVEVAAEGEQDLIVKFGEETFDETDEIKIISSSEHELDITAEVYEYIHLLMPNRIVHDSLSECNQEVISKLQELNKTIENKEADPRWAALSKLKGNNE